MYGQQSEGNIQYEYPFISSRYPRTPAHVDLDQVRLSKVRREARCIYAGKLAGETDLVQAYICGRENLSVNFFRLRSAGGLSYL